MENQSGFELAYKFTKRWEGGYVNDPDDPGGETKYGISKRAYPDEDITNLTEERAKELYRRDYWDVMGCDKRSLCDGVAVFDTAVNCGVSRTAIWLDSTRNAEELLAQRRSHYELLAKKKPKMKKYLKGWLNRIEDLHKYLKELTPQSG